MYMGLHFIRVWNWNWQLTGDHVLINDWIQSTHRSSAPLLVLRRIQLMTGEPRTQLQGAQVLGESGSCATSRILQAHLQGKPIYIYFSQSAQTCIVIECIKSRYVNLNLVRKHILMFCCTHAIYQGPSQYKYSYYEYRDSYYKDKTVSRPSCLYNGNPQTWKYWSNGELIPPYIPDTIRHTQC